MRRTQISDDRRDSEKETKRPKAGALDVLVVVPQYPGDGAEGGAERKRLRTAMPPCAAALGAVQLAQAVDEFLVLLLSHWRPSVRLT
jgi:hypothetical protein